jgi:hypothetical protein
VEVAPLGLTPRSPPLILRIRDLKSNLSLQGVQGVSRRLQDGLTDAPAQLQGKRVARMFSQMVVSLHTERQHPPHHTACMDTMHSEPELDGAGLMPAEEPGVLFEDEDLSLLHEEVWWAHHMHAPDLASQGAAGQVAQDESRADAAQVCMHVYIACIVFIQTCADATLQRCSLQAAHSTSGTKQEAPIREVEAYASVRILERHYQEQMMHCN